jgi:hypothetical protein
VLVHVENIVDVFLNVDVFGDVAHWTQEYQRLKLDLTHFLTWWSTQRSEFIIFVGKMFVV